MIERIAEVQEIAAELSAEAAAGEVVGLVVLMERVDHTFRVIATKDLAVVRALGELEFLRHDLITHAGS